MIKRKKRKLKSYQLGAPVIPRNPNMDPAIYAPGYQSANQGTLRGKKVNPFSREETLRYIQNTEDPATYNMVSAEVAATDYAGMLAPLTGLPLLKGLKQTKKLAEARKIPNSIPKESSVTPYLSTAELNKKTFERYNINPETWEVLPKKGGNNLAVFTHKKMPYVLKVESPHQVDYLPKDISLPEYFDPVRHLSENVGMPMIQGKITRPNMGEARGLLINRVPGKPLNELTPRELRKIPQESFGKLYNTVKELRNNNIAADWIGDNIVYDKTKKSFNMFDLSPIPSKINKKAGDSEWWENHVLKGVNPDNPSQSADIIRKMILDKYIGSVEHSAMRQLADKYLLSSSGDRINKYMNATKDHALKKREEIRNMMIDLGDKRHGGIINDNRGQWAHPGKTTRIQSPNITMKGVNYPVLGKPNKGTPQMMYPNQDYFFPGANYVTEYPMKKKQMGGGMGDHLNVFPMMMQTGGTSADSLRQGRDKIIQYDAARGSKYGTPLPQYEDTAYYNKYWDDNVAPQLTPYSSAIEKTEAGDFIFNAGKDPKKYAYQEYLREKTGTDWNERNTTDSLTTDSLYKANISPLPKNDRRVLMNKGRDWYYKNTYREEPGMWYGKDNSGNPIRDEQGALSPAYANTWYGRIWNTNDLSKFNPMNPKFTPKKQEGGSTAFQTPDQPTFPEQRKSNFLTWLKTTSMAELQSQMDENPLGLEGEVLNAFKKGGFKINPAHKGWCTPMTKSTCTGKRRQFAINAKNHFKKQQDGGELDQYQPGGPYSRWEDFIPHTGQFATYEPNQAPKAPQVSQTIIQPQAEPTIPMDPGMQIPMNTQSEMTYNWGQKPGKMNRPDWKDRWWASPDIMNAGMEGITNIANWFDRQKKEKDLRRRTSADNLYALEEGDRGKYSSLYGYFDPVNMTPVEQPGAYGLKTTKHGGQYQDGGEYNLSQEEINALADNYDVEYLD